MGWKSNYKEQLDVIIKTAGVNDFFDKNFVESKPPKYPKNPTILSDSEVGEFYALFVEWASYTKQQLSLLEAELTILKNMLKISYAQAIENLVSKGVKRTSAQRIALNEDPDCLDIQNEIALKEAQRIVVQGRYEHFDFCVKGLSREISRRKLNVEQSFLNAEMLKENVMQNSKKSKKS